MNFNLRELMRENFSIRVFIIFTTFIFFICFSFTAFFIHRQSQSLTDTLLKNGLLLIKTLAYNSRIGVFSENEELLDGPAEGIFKLEEIKGVIIFNTEGKLLKKRVDPQEVGIKKSIENGIETNKNIFEKLAKNQSPFFLEKPDRIDFWSPVMSGSAYSREVSLFFEENSDKKNNRVIGFVKIVADKKILNRQISDLLFKSSLMGIIFWIIGSGMAFFMAKMITNPLKRLTKGIKALGMGKIIDKIPVETGDEVGKLAIAFNDMFESLKKRDKEKEQLEEQLRQAQKMEAIGTLAGGIAHDFNNILTRIIGYSELILKKIGPKDPIRKKIEGILEDGQRAESLTRQLLIFSRKEVIDPREFSVNDLTENLGKMLSRLIGENIKLKTLLSSDTSLVRADSKQIEQVIINLAINARDAISEAGIITIKIWVATLDESEVKDFNDVSPGNYVLLSVKDTGCGMTEEIKSKIFEPFFTTKEVGKGTGLGMSTVYGIIKQHNKGGIRVQSKINKGSTITICLPRLEKLTEPEIIKETTQELPRGTETILFAEDDYEIRKLMSRALKESGFTVHGAKNGKDALLLLKKIGKTIDLLLTDIIMPRMGGIKLAEQIASNYPGIKILFISGYSDQKIDRNNFASSLVFILQKPFMSSALVRKVREVLDAPNNSINPSISLEQKPDEASTIS